jgi:hypothetical protein
MSPELVAEVFTRIHDQNLWGSPESVSGGGSALEATTKIRAEIPALIAQHGILSMLDLPCGDFNWMGEMLKVLPDLRYTGGDVVVPLIEKNIRKYPTIRFEVLDVISSPLAQHDLVFCRDCLVHLPEKLVRKAIENIKESNCRFLLATTFPKAIPQDIEVGQWRPLNLIPFLGEPIQVISECFADLDGVPTEKQLGLWRFR